MTASPETTIARPAVTEAAGSDVERHASYKYDAADNLVEQITGEAASDAHRVRTEYDYDLLGQLR